jgi:hypothetical protein
MALEIDPDPGGGMISGLGIDVYGLGVRHIIRARQGR